MSAESLVHSEPEPQERVANAVAVVSGKGGVGKTNLVANLAVAVARRGPRVLVVDGDLSLANVDVLLGLTPKLHVGDVIDGHCGLRDAIIPGPHGVELLPASSARPELAALGAENASALMSCVFTLARDYELVLVDAGAGIGPTVMGLANACPRVVVVTTPEPTSLADAYATVKVLARRAPRRTIEVLVNAARSPREGYETFEHLSRLAERFLGISLHHLGVLPHDPRLAEAVAQQRPVVDLFPTAPCSRQLVALSATLLDRCGPNAAPQPKPHRWRRLGASR